MLKLDMTQGYGTKTSKIRAKTMGLVEIDQEI
jgi:hypothetical protein